MKPKQNPKRVTPLDHKLGRIIRDRRKKMGLSQEDIATAGGFSYQQMQKYEAGKNRLSVSHFVAIAQCLDLKPSQILRKIAA